MGRSSITELIPERALGRFLHRQAGGRKLVLVAITGAHAYGFPHGDSPLELKAIHVEPTESLLSLSKPHGTDNWVDEFEGYHVDYSSRELGESLERLLRGDGAVLERILAPRQLVRSHDLARLQDVARGVVCRRFYGYYRNFCRGMLDDWAEAKPSLQHVLSAYRTALTGVHLLRAGEVVLDLLQLARTYKLPEVPRLIRESREKGGAEFTATGPWLKLLVRLSAQLEDAYDSSNLPSEPERPERAEAYVLDMRRRFFDALTVPD